MSNEHYLEHSLQSDALFAPEQDRMVDRLLEQVDWLVEWGWLHLIGW